MTTGTESLQRYGRLSIALHWVMLLLIVCVYAAIELRVYFLKGSEVREGLKTWHFMLGLTVLLLVFIRLVARFVSGTPPITPVPPRWQSLVSRAVHLALYGLMIAMPLAGWVILSASGKAIPFWGLQLPALVAASKPLAEQVKELHETAGLVGYWLIGLHTAAALFHHYGMRDDTLKRMLFGRIRARGSQLLTREALPFYLSLTALVAAALVIDAVLHLLDAVWIGRWIGIPGLVLILGSFGYSLVKRKLMQGRALPLLRVHERMAWAGSLLVLVHAGVHFNALLPWLAVAAMLVNVGSGLTGKYLLARSKLRLKETKSALQQAGVPDDQIEARTHFDSMTIGIVQQWRVVHFPITLAFGMLALAHILSTLLFWNWR